MPDRDLPDISAAPFDDLLREVLNRVKGVLDEQARLRLLIDAVGSMAADLSLDEALARIVEIARAITGARYAALGVLGSGPDKRLRSFVHDGMSHVQVSEIGSLPTGHGLLGLLIDLPQPVRLHDIASHPESYGFPPAHPPMSSFLGVPVRIRDQVFGNLYLTEKAGGADFTQQDEDVTVALAAAAGTAVQNARLYEDVGRREAWLAATADIAGLLSGANVGDDALQLVADRALEVAVADVAWIVVQKGENLAVRAISGPDVNVEDLDGFSLHQSLSREVLRTGEPIVLENMEADPRATKMSHIQGWPEVGPAMLVPLRTHDLVVGALALAWTPAHSERFHEVDARLPASFAEHAGLALQVLASRDAEQRLAVLEDRDRIGRDLHDLVIQRLFAVGLGLHNVSRMSDVAEMSRRTEAAVTDLDATIKDIRRSIFALGSVEEATDLQTEVTQLVDRAAATLKFRPSLELEGPLRSVVGDDTAPHLLAVLGEALSNASRHAHATNIHVRVSARDDLQLVVADNGEGIPPDFREGGLRNLRDRAKRLGGTCVVDSSPAGTTITWTVPLS